MYLWPYDFFVMFIYCPEVVMHAFQRALEESGFRVFSTSAAQGKDFYCFFF